MSNQVKQTKAICLAGIAAAMLITGAAFAVGGSAIGEMVEGVANLKRDGGSTPAGSGDVVFSGDSVVTGSGKDATVELLEGGKMYLMESSSVELKGGLALFGAEGGGCLSGLARPVNIVVNGVPVATGVTSGGVFNGVFYPECAQAIAALEAAGGGTSGLVKAFLTIGGFALAYEVTKDDNPVHGN